MVEKFNDENTEGYSEEQLAELNAIWEGARANPDNEGIDDSNLSERILTDYDSSKYFGVVDRETGKTLNGQVLERVQAGDAELLQIALIDCGMTISMVLYPDGAQWTPWNWDDRVNTVEDIPEAGYPNPWLRQDKHVGIMLNGLPRALE